MKMRRNDMDVQNLLCAFFALRDSETRTSDAYKVIGVSKNNKHKLGCTEEGFPIFFVECSDFQRTSDIRLQLVDVFFNKDCSLYTSDNEIICKTYCMVILKSLQKDLIQYFFEVFNLILKRLSAFPTTTEVSKEVAKIVRLFMNLPTYSQETLQGLWAEMLVIEQSRNPDYLVNSWHVSTVDKYDFNDGMDKIEVKSTAKSLRQHLFALEQLNPNENSKLLIASLHIVKTGIGLNIFDLEKKIVSKLKNNESSLKIKEIILKTLGTKFSEASDVHFDYAMATDTLKFYDYKDVPSIKTNNVPDNVSNVHFTSDLTNIPDINRESMSGLLHESL